MKYVRPKEAASILGVAVSSLRRWEEEGKIKAIKTPSGHRRYSIEEIEQAAGLPRTITTVCYARVSSHSQRDDIEGQKSQRKINRKSVRNMLSWSHGKFASHLEQIAAGKGVLVVRCNESYPSKTCTNCGHIHNNLGGSKIYKCPQCGHSIARDINGARNIMLRALQD